MCISWGNNNGGKRYSKCKVTGAGRAFVYSRNTKEVSRGRVAGQVREDMEGWSGNRSLKAGPPR